MERNRPSTRGSSPHDAASVLMPATGSMDLPEASLAGADNKNERVGIQKAAV